MYEAHCQKRRRSYLSTLRIVHSSAWVMLLEKRTRKVHMRFVAGVNGSLIAPHMSAKEQCVQLVSR